MKFQLDEDPYKDFYKMFFLFGVIASLLSVIGFIVILAIFQSIF